MADKISYPQIPATVWWGVRSLLDRTPNATISERTLGVELNVQEVAARQYLAELKRVGVLNEDQKATPLAQKWRRNETYGEAVDELLALVYPEELIQIAPRGSADRQKIISWFAREGLGSGTAANKAATYLLISSAVPSDANLRTPTKPQKTATKNVSARPGPTNQTLKPSLAERRNDGLQANAIPLNVNAQIHISAEVSSDQIETIFAAMRRYLYDNPTA